MQPTRRRTPRAALILLMLTLVTLGLTACGAEIQTKLIVNDDGSGERVIVATVSRSDLAKVTGGVRTIESIITASIPADLAYTGSSAPGSGGAVLTFRLPFANQADYQAKVTSVLAAGGPLPAKVEALIDVGNTPFRQGVRVKENFTSIQLLGWLENALVAHGAVSNDDKGNLTTPGEAHVVHQGVGHRCPEPLAYSHMDTRGFSHVEVLTSGLDTPTPTRTITYTMSSETYRLDPTGFDGWLAKATPNGGQLTKGASGSSWVLTFTATPAEIQSGTDLALGAAPGTSVFTIATKPGSSPTSVTAVVSDASSCKAICDSGTSVSMQLAVPQGWSGPAISSEGTTPSSQTGTSLHRKAAFSATTLFVDLTQMTSPRAELTLFMRLGEAELVGPSIDAWLDTQVSGVEVIRSDSGGIREWHVVITATSADELLQRLDSFTIAVGGTAGNRLATSGHDGFFSTTAADRFTLTILSIVPSDSAPATASITLTYPAGWTIDGHTAADAKVTRNTVAFTAPMGAPVSVEIERHSITWEGHTILGGGILILVGLGLAIARTARRRQR